MKQEYKTITAIATYINGAINYISNQSIREDNKYLPQFHTDPVHAKEFESDEIYLTDEEQAAYYLTNVHNPYHRVYNIVKVQIPIIKDLKKYDRDKQKVQTRTIPGTGAGKKILTDALLIFIACIVLVSCSKSQVPPPERSFAVYQLIGEHYTLDSIFINRYILWQDTVFKKNERAKVDTIMPQWFRICDAQQKPTHLEYRYYKRDGIKIQ